MDWLTMDWLTIWLASAVSCAVLGGMIGKGNQAGGAGFFLGLLFGPLGVIAAFAMDGRSSCSRCGGRLNGQPEVCQHCGATIERDQLFAEKSAQPDSSAADRSVKCSSCGVVVSNAKRIKPGSMWKCPVCAATMLLRR